MLRHDKPPAEAPGQQACCVPRFLSPPGHAPWLPCCVAQVVPENFYQKQLVILSLPDPAPDGHPEMGRRPGVHKDTGETIDTGKHIFVR